MHTSAALKGQLAASTLDPEDSGVRAGVRLRDPQALAVVYQAYWPKLSRHAQLILPESMDPEDAAADVFLHVIENAGSYDPAYPLYSWLARICVNLCLNRRKRSGLGIVKRWLRSPRSARFTSPEGPTPEVVASEARNALRTALGTLSSREREAVALRYLFLLDETEIAKTLRIERGAVATAISRGLANLKKGHQGRDLRTWWESSGETP